MDGDEVGLTQICYAFDSCLRLLVGRWRYWMRMAGAEPPP